MGFGMTRLLASSITLFILLTKESSAQEGFVSLKCCAQSNFSSKAGIIWIPDDEFLLSKGKCQDIILPLTNATSHERLRVFDTESIWKFCYTLPTLTGHKYLIRATFLHDLVKSPEIISFNVSIGPTLINEVISSDDNTVVEVITEATGQSTDLCLVKGNGNPYISMLELRPITEPQYPESNAESILKLLDRVDAGNKEDEIRYPDDLSDRIWKKDAHERSINFSITNNNSFLPVEVLESAANETDLIPILYKDLGKEKYDYLTILHFTELILNVTKGQRLMDIYVNNELVYASFDMHLDAINYARVALRINEVKDLLNVSLVKAQGSLYGPICNAYEIFQVYHKEPGTRVEDVRTMMEVRNVLLQTNPKTVILKSWAGDPCRPSPWKGLDCQLKKEFVVITKLDLSSSELQGPLPNDISNLADLTDINVRNNDFSGSIPESFSRLQNLKTLLYGCNLHLELPIGLSNQSKIVTDNGECTKEISSNPEKSQTFVIGTVVGGSAFFIFVGGIFACFRWRSRKIEVTKAVTFKNAVFSIPSMDNIDAKSICIQTFTLQAIEDATDKFKTMIGEGGFGSVYRGTLPPGQEIAVKVRSATSTQGTREFENELNLLSAIRHENLVPLLGYCCENDQQILVYPFMSNGSLQDRLYGDASKRKVLDWPTRLSVALGAARGLLYLHTFAGRSIIHRDIKSSNILLDNSMCAKVADFGFSKYAPQEGDSGVSLEVRGTAGYMDPEYYSTQHLSSKSDVFSFGVVLLEIMTGREPLNTHRPRNEWSLIEWAKPYLLSSKIEEIVDQNIKFGYHAEAMWRVAEAALSCIEPFSTYRPSMEEIVREIEDALIIENNASEYMKSIESLGGSNRFYSTERKAVAVTPAPSEPSPDPPQTMAPPEPR